MIDIVKKYQTKIIKTDIFIIGAGLAGMTAAIEVLKADKSLVIATKGRFGRSGSSYITRAGFSVALGDKNPKDNPEKHYKDTLKSGKCINDKKLVRLFVNLAPKYLCELEKYGVKFDKKGDKFRQYLGGGHTYSRMIYTINKNGPDITLPLSQFIQRQDKTQILEDNIVIDLQKKENKLLSICFHKNKKSFTLIISKAIIIATGGGAQMYKITANPKHSTGDGFVLAYNLGAELIDMEFVQHYPLEVLWPKAKDLHADIAASLPSLGAVTRNKNGEAFMKNYDPKGDLATRDVHSRGLFSEIQAGRGVKGGVWLDLSKVDEKDMKNTIPEYYEYFKKRNLAKKDWRVIVAPGAHYFMGGIKINEKAESSVKGLFACGEAVGGIDGANRLACNSLPECLVFGHIAGINAGKYCNSLDIDLKNNIDSNSYIESLVSRYLANKKVDFKQEIIELKKIMWDKGGIVKSGKGLKKALEFVNKKWDGFDEKIKIKSLSELPRLIEFKNLLHVSRMILSSALKRQESRGSHYRLDYPNLDKKWKKNIIIRENESTKG